MRNAPNVRFRGRMDPRPDPSLATLEARWGLTIGSGGFAISCDARNTASSTPAELLQWVEQDLSEDPSSRVARLERARLLMTLGRNEDALKEAGRVRRELRGDPLHRRAKDLEEPTIVEGCCLMRMARVDELEALVSENHSEYAPTTDTLFLEGVVATARQDNDWAVESFRRALEIEGDPSFAAELDEVRGPALPNLLGTVLMAKDDVAAAREAFDLALTRDPDNLEAQFGKTSLRLASGEIRELLEDLDRLIESRGEDPRVWVTGGVILSQLPQLGAATVAWHEEAVSRFPDHHGLRRQLGDALLRNDNAERAIETWPEQADEDPARVAARVTAALACGHDLPEVADDDDEELVGQVLTWFARLLSYRAERSLDRVLLDLRRAEPSIPGLIDGTAGWLDRVGQTEAAEKLRAEPVGV